jgi:hypothetical protein
VKICLKIIPTCASWRNIDTRNAGRHAEAERVVHVIAALALRLDAGGPWRHLDVGWLQILGEVKEKSVWSLGVCRSRTREQRDDRQRERSHERSCLPSEQGVDERRDARAREENQQPEYYDHGDDRQQPPFPRGLQKAPQLAEEPDIAASRRRFFEAL